MSTFRYGVGLWKNITNLWDEFYQNCRLQVGNGTNIKFRKDKWLGHSALQTNYPNIFLIFSNPDSTISQNRADNAWNPQLRRNLQNWELEELLTLLERLENCITNEQISDRLRWGDKTDGLYSVKAGYSILCAQNEMVDNWP